MYLPLRLSFKITKAKNCSIWKKNLKFYRKYKGHQYIIVILYNQNSIYTLFLKVYGFMVMNVKRIPYF